jgi:uncharacterized membrane protein YphA (DoxX/SURF4 family)
MRDPESEPPKAPAWPLAAVRVYLGVIFAVAGIGQLLGASPWGRATDWPTSLQRYFGMFRAKPAAFYSGFFQLLIVHKDLVAVLLPWIHVIIGVALVLGVATRITTVVALFLLVNYMALTGVMPYGPDPISPLAALALVVCLANPDIWRVGPALARWRSLSRGR